MKKFLALLLAVIMVVGILPASVSATETTPSVTVYFSVSHDGEFEVGSGNTVMALKEITVPYFDLAKYGLESFYFSSEDYTDDGDGLPGSDLTPGTAEYAYGKVTMLHLFLYAMEVYYYGIPVSEAGQGWMYNNGKMGGSDINIGGSVGSMFMNNYWGMDYNLNYYLNYEYPLASTGWGATADQILLEDGDIVSYGHFSGWSFYNDPNSIFSYAKASSEISATTAANRGAEVTVTMYHAGADNSGNYTTAQTVWGEGIPVYLAPVGVSNSNFDTSTEWSLVGTTDSNGQVDINTSALTSGRYIVAMAGQYGEEYSSDICCTPGGILLDVSVIYGDVNGDGAVTIDDADFVYDYVNGEGSLSAGQFEAADVNCDGAVTSDDADYIYDYADGLITSLPVV